MKARVASGDAAAQMLYGRSEQAETMREQVRRLAALEGPVLIEGAPGAGIEKVAEVIHLLSSRAERAFLRVGAAALSPEQLAAQVDACGGGTVFMDQVTSLPPETQFALLGLLDSEPKARILVGTFSASADFKTFNADLHYRLDALKVRIPALKERPEDIPVLFRQYVRQASEQTGVKAPPITQEVIADLMAEDWPGNARALMNAATRFVLGLGADDVAEDLGLSEKLAQVERALLIDGLKRNGGNASLTAEQFKIPRKTLYDKFAKHGIQPKSYR
ncbi:MAG: sigma-54-dependent Fis family transcriptional regulator [Silicimonas sp.]|nr:sigma-54-dependent Fis family transcriptional regulator [Silicimonas sp.]